MAQTLAERLKAAKSPRARISDNEKLLEDLKVERERLDAARDRAAGESIDFALSEEDRDEAAAKAARYERTSKALEAEISALATSIEERRSDDAAKAVEAEKAAALAERDTLAKEFAEFVPNAAGRLADLFRRVEANKARMQSAGVRERCAEAKARDVPAFRGIAGDAPRYLDMKIPAWHGHQRAWPPEVNHGDWIAKVEQDRQRQIVARDREQESKRKAAEKHAREHGQYQLKSKFLGDHIHRLPAEIVDQAPNLPATITAWSPWRGVLPHALIDQIREAEPNLSVTRLDERRK